MFILCTINKLLMLFITFLNISQKEEYENELSVTKRRLNKYQQKLERLNIANRNVESDFDSYVQAVRKFENCSIESADSKFKVVDECISLIEEMESVM